jgi:predicted heme/steroid binding protein
MLATSMWREGEVQALRDKCKELADDVRALATLVNALRGALVSVGVVKGGA